MTIFHKHHASTDKAALPPTDEATSPTNPARSDTLDSMASTDAVPKESGDIGVTFEERLRAWKHVVGNLTKYVEQHEDMHKHMAKEIEKIHKTIADPLMQAEMFTQQSGGVQALFENLRANTNALSNSHLETGKSLKSGVVPQLERLHAEIKSKAKEVTSGATKGTKAVTKAREATKKHIDQLTSQSGQFDSVGGGTKLHDPISDPYILRRGVMHRLHKQVAEENANRQDLLAVQSGFQQFEAHIIQTLQHCMQQFFAAVSAGDDKEKALYGDMQGHFSRLPVDYEWKAFTQRYSHVLIDPAAPNRDVSAIRFPNEDHTSTRPLIEGTLLRKGKILGRYSNAYYVVTRSKYLHEFADNDDFKKDPEPELSLYLPDCKIGALSAAPDAKFTLSGKDANKNQTFTREHDFVFKAATHEDGQKWWEVISHACGVRTGEVPDASPGVSRENTLSPQATGTTAAPTMAGAGGVGGASAGVEKMAINDAAPAQKPMA